MTDSDRAQARASRASIERLRAAQYDFDLAALKRLIPELFAPDAALHLAHPIGALESPEELAAGVYAALKAALPDLERRDTIVIAGRTLAGAHWVGCCGYYTGRFANAWLDIPPTGHFAAMRFHEFYRMDGGRIVEMQSLWDIPELMMQADVWPMSPSLGREWQAPGPATQDGLFTAGAEEPLTRASFDLAFAMCESLGNFAGGGAEAMHLERYWHPRCSWYGPSGIGSARGIAGFRNWHQIPFLRAMPDRVGHPAAGHLFAQGAYVGFTAWPGMHMSISGDGWLGIAPGGQRIGLRSLDFWRCENGLIRENWVLVDILDVYRQIGVDVLARMRELAAARGRA